LEGTPIAVKLQDAKITVIIDRDAAKRETERVQKDRKRGRERSEREEGRRGASWT